MIFFSIRNVNIFPATRPLTRKPSAACFVIVPYTAWETDAAAVFVTPKMELRIAAIV